MAIYVPIVMYVLGLFIDVVQELHVHDMLDINITIIGRKYRTKIYDKRDDYNFRIVNFPYMNSNIPIKPAYGIYISQLGRICEEYSAFMDRNRMITDRLIKQGFCYSKLCKTFKKFSRKHRTIFNRQHIDEGICRPLCIIRKLSKNITMNKCRHMSTLPRCT